MPGPRDAMQTITSQDAVRRGEREPLWTLFRVVFGLSALSWGGLALMAQLEHHYVEREGRLSRVAFSDLRSRWRGWCPARWDATSPCELGHALRGRSGAWVSGIASALPFFMLMTLFAIFYRSPLVHVAASQTLLNHFSRGLATLIAITWYKQTRALVRGRLEWIAAVLGCVALFYAHSAAAYVVMLGSGLRCRVLVGEPGARQNAWSGQLLRRGDGSCWSAKSGLLSPLFAPPSAGSRRTGAIPWPAAFRRRA